jgi:hypothetical protein
MGLRRYIPEFAVEAVRKLRSHWFRSRARRRLGLKRSQRRVHGLDLPLIVSLTSYPRRFPTLHLTLACLLDQSIRADRTILWIAHHDMDALPGEVRALQANGLEIRTCDDLGPFKKLIPALEAFPDAYVATADDDLYYPRDWLEVLVREAQRGTIVCHRAHRPVRAADGGLASYACWERNVQDRRARQASTDIMPTSGAGVLYPPGSLHEVATDRRFLSLCASGDDLWYWWTSRMAGTKSRKVGPLMWVVAWPESQADSLWAGNEAGGNDRMIAALEAELGQLS